jgi:hypothetical protein
VSKLTPQQQIVLDQLSAGRSLTNIVALTCHGVGSLSSRIAELRRLGHKIEDRTETDQFERQYKVYSIKAAKVGAAVETIVRTAEGNDAP